jgi:hypothetical protein
MQGGERDGARALLADDFDGRVESHQGLGEVPRIGRDALVADAEDGMRAVESLHRGTARAWVALVAFGIGRVAEIGATGALQDISAQARHVPQLLAGGELERACERREVADHVGVAGGIRHAN